MATLPLSPSATGLGISFIDFINIIKFTKHLLEPLKRALLISEKFLLRFL